MTRSTLTHRLEALRPERKAMTTTLPKATTEAVGIEATCACETPMSERVARFIADLRDPDIRLSTEKEFRSSSWGAGMKAEVAARLEAHAVLVRAMESIANEFEPGSRGAYSKFKQVQAIARVTLASTARSKAQGGE